MIYKISNISEEICSTTLQFLPLCKSSVKEKKWYKDQTLSRLASAKKVAWDNWSANGRPKEGVVQQLVTKHQKQSETKS